MTAKSAKILDVGAHLHLSRDIEVLSALKPSLDDKQRSCELFSSGTISLVCGHTRDREQRVTEGAHACEDRERGMEAQRAILIVYTNVGGGLVVEDPHDDAEGEDIGLAIHAHVETLCAAFV